jgi:hypothetical protein
MAASTNNQRTLPIVVSTQDIKAIEKWMDLVHVVPDSMITNFAQAVWEECKRHYGIDADKAAH